MALPTVDTNQLGGGTGRPAPGFDYYSSLVVYGTAPTVTGKWATYAGPPVIKAQQMFTDTDALDAGILPYTENTAATGTYLISSAGATGDKLELVVTYPLPNATSATVSLGIYTVLAGQTTIAAQGAAAAAIINANTITHGFTASFNTATITVTAPKTYGLSLNTGTPLAAVITGTFAGTVTQFSAGTASQWACWEYQIREYFRLNPTGNLWVCVISAPSAFEEIKAVQKAAASKIRQLGIYDIDTTKASAANITGTITQIQAVAVLIQKTAPLSVIYSPNIKAITDLSTYPDQNINTANKVSCILSQDGNAEGALHFVRNGQTIGHVGAKLATVSKSRVSASDAQPIDLFNISDGVENNIPAFGNGSLSANVAEGVQVQLDGYNYTFVREFGDTVVGTYWTGNKCCIKASSDYANINDNRTSDKIARICYSTYIPKLNSELIFNTDGTLTNAAVETFIDDGEGAITAEMITGFGVLPLISGVKITIDPTQPVKQTNNLTVVVKIVQNGIARNITVNIGYALSL